MTKISSFSGGIGSIVRPNAILLLLGLVCPAMAIGGSWTTNGPTYKTIKVVATSPQHSTVVYAGAFGWGVFKSTDGGATWANVRTGLVNTYVRSLLVLSDTVVYAGTNDGVYKTTDGGQHWSYILATPFSVRSLAIDPRTGSMYCASFGSGLYKTTNLGSTWSSITVTDLSTGQTLSHLWGVSSYGKDSIYVGGSILDIPPGSGGAFFRSVDGGASWFQMQFPVAIRSSVHSIAISPTDPARGFIIGTATRGVYNSTDGGLHFNNIDGQGTVTPLPDLHINSVGFTPSVYYAGTDSIGQVYYRLVSDVSNGWSVAAGLPGKPALVNCVKIDNTNNNILFAGIDGRGVYESTNAGANWQARNTGMLGTAGRAIVRNGNGNLILGTNFGDGIWISADTAATWTKIDSLSTVDDITSIGITSNVSIVYAAAYGAGVFKSTDGGHIWQLTDSTVINIAIRTVSVHPSDPNIVFAGTGNGVYKTTNGGASWFASNAGMPASTSIRSMALDARSPNVVYAGTDSSFLYKTTDGGNSWLHFTSSNGFLPQDVFTRSITIDYNSPATVYAGSDSGRIYKSTNAGSNWALLAQLPATHSVRRILIHPNDHKVFFAATFGDGIFGSADSGGHWLPFNSGLSDLDIYSLSSDSASPINLYAGSGTRGVFHTTFSTVNQAPVLSPIGNKSVLSGHQLSFTVSATDPDLTIPSLAVHGLLPGATFIDSLNGHGLFKWTPTIAQVGNHPVTVIAADGSLADSQAVSITVLDSSNSAIINLTIAQGWNILSVPVTVSDFRRVAIFPPPASSVAFGYSGSYVIADTLAIGSGYWLRFSSNQDLDIGGGRILRDTVDVIGGWNLVGSISSPIAATQARGVSPVAVSSSVYGYTPATGYFRADSLKPGRGYWLKVNESGKITLDVSAAQAKALPGVDPGSQLSNARLTGDINRISMIDRSGGERQLFFSSNAEFPNRQQFELPPRPPEGVFDVRFASQSSLATCRRVSREQEFPIEISGAEAPVTVRWNVVEQTMTPLLELMTANQSPEWRTLRGSGSLVVHEPIFGAKLRLLPASAPSGSYALDQNFPNPFNPSTVIRYYLPSESRVELRVCNVLGQFVANLVDHREGAGDKSVTWNAGRFASGVYVCRLRVFDALTGELKFQNVKNMYLLK